MDGDVYTWGIPDEGALGYMPSRGSNGLPQKVPGVSLEDLVAQNRGEMICGIEASSPRGMPLKTNEQLASHHGRDTNTVVAKIHNDKHKCYGEIIAICLVIL